MVSQNLEFEDCIMNLAVAYILESLEKNFKDFKIINWYTNSQMI